VKGCAIRSYCILKNQQDSIIADYNAAYAAYAQQNAQVTHAECWSHNRRGFEHAQESEPIASAEALALIGALYRHERIIRDQGGWRARRSSPTEPRTANRS
jgi:Transposase IS66 family